MPAPAHGPLGWTRRIPGSVVLGFFLLSAGLWTGCLLAWEIREPELVVALMAFAAFVPLVWLGIRLQARPVWVLVVHQDPARAANALRTGGSGPLPTELAANRAGHSGLFRGCDAVLRFEDPACVVGLRRSTGEPETTLLLLPLSTKREALDRLRSTIADRLHGGS